MAKSIIPGVPHIPKTPKVGYLGRVNVSGVPSGQPRTLKIQPVVARISPLKREQVQVGKMKPGSDI